MTVFVDLDGVLADFDNGMKKAFGLYPDEFESVGKMWKSAYHHSSFFESLPLMHDAEKLWNYVIQFDPVILTGVPYGGWAENQKREWVKTHFGDVQVITCFSKDKFKHGCGGDILIDDRMKAKDPWVGMGGIFIHHTSTERTIRKIKML